MIVVAIIATFIYMSNPEIKLEMQQQQEKAMREQFDKMVAERTNDSRTSR